MDEVTHTVSAETFVVLTTLLLVLRFLLDFLGPWHRTWSFMLFLVPSFEALNYSMVHYTMGLMQLSSEKVNSYFQVWAVLLTTLQYSVKTGRPYNRSRQIPLLDLMASFWAANLLRLRTFSLLRTPLWLIWSLNAARIISYFASSNKQEAINQESLRLTADYMSYEHGISSSSSQHSAAADPSSSGKGFTMDSYKYMVLGENQVLRDIIQENINCLPAVQQTHQQEHAQRRKKQKHRIRLDPAVHQKLITLDKIWNVDSGESGLLGVEATADPSNRLKDVCLSFALYKLLRRRFYDLPLHEARLPRQGVKIRRLVFDYILRDAERAFRVVGTQLSFLQDLFYSKHAATFADGFPAMNLALSLLLVVTTGYIAYPVRHIPERMDKADRNRITHGVLITRIIVALIVGKELAEIYMYIFSQWTKVLMLSSYAKHRCLRHPLMESVMRVMLFFMTRDRWDEKICQHNILISTRAVKLGRFTCYIWSKFPKGIKMEACTKEAIFQSIRRLEKNPERLDSYFTNAFGGPNQRIHGQLLWAVDDLEADTHRILVWHIATCLCEIDLVSDKAAVAFRPGIMCPVPFVKRPIMGSNKQPDSSSTGIGSVEAAMPMWWEHYRTAASLSNYCAYLVMQKLLPDNGLVALKVWSEVYREIVHITMDGSIRSLLNLRSMKDVFTCLMRTANMPHNKHVPVQGKPDEEAPPMSSSEPTEKEQTAHHRGDRDPLDINNSLTCKGAELAKQLMAEYGEDKVGLWEKLAVFWTGFLLHLAASTRASKHRTLLAGSRELSTHLWALLSHAGFLGRTSHGQVALDRFDRSAFENASELP